MNNENYIEETIDDYHLYTFDRTDIYDADNIVDFFFIEGAIIGLLEDENNNDLILYVKLVGDMDPTYYFKWGCDISEFHKIYFGVAIYDESSYRLLRDILNNCKNNICERYKLR
jgi:hypothetical protein